MAINLQTGEWFSMGEAMKGMSEAERKRYLDTTLASLQGALNTIEHGGTPDLQSVNRIITGHVQPLDALCLPPIEHAPPRTAATPTWGAKLRKVVMRLFAGRQAKTKTP
jgi:hypothetical protein